MAVSSRRRAARPGPAPLPVFLSALAGGVACVGASLAQAQPAACEQFKATLAARLSAHPSTYTLEAVPGGTPLPAGAKVVGNCGGGAWKVVMRRGSAPPLAAGAPAADAGAAPAEGPAPPPAPALRASAPTPQPAPAPAPAPPRVTSDPPSPARAPAPAPLAAAAPAAPPETPANAPTAPAESAPPDDADADSGWVRRATLLATSHGAWVAPLVLLPLLWLGWGWFVRRRDYDEAGLPRGPRL